MAVALYEHPAWQQTPDQVMRPGGREITECALAICDLPSGSRVLDVGCGLGATLNHITAREEWKAFGVDISAKLLRQAHQNSPKSFFAQARGEHLPFAGRSLDAIIAECTLSIMDTALVLQECIRMLKHGGYLIINDVYARNESGIEALRNLPQGTCIGSATSQAQILKGLEQCGLRLIWWQDCSESLKEFPVCTLTTAAEVDPFDLFIAASRAKLGYYSLVAQNSHI